MKYFDEAHRKFVLEKYEVLKEFGKTDCYYKALVYILGICEPTRKNFNRIFSIEEGEINIDSLISGFQTDSSAKVTRMAFSLWNGCSYDSSYDAENEVASIDYNTTEIFSCSFAPYFYEGIRIRYSDYCKKNFEEVEDDKHLGDIELESL